MIAVFYTVVTAGCARQLLNRGAAITGVETGLDWRTATEKQLAAIPGISGKGAWNLISTRAKAISKNRTIENVDDWFNSAGIQIPEIVDISKILI